MNARHTITSLGAAAAALLLGTTIAFASPAQGPVAPTAGATNTVTVERRGGPPTRPQPTRPVAATPGANLPAPVDGPLPDEVVALITRVRRRAGGFRSLKVNLCCELRTDGSPALVSGTMQDVTDERLTEEKLRHSSRMDAVGSARSCLR